MEHTLQQVLADTFAMYVKAHNFHWNVVGINFKQFHDFFGGIYESLWNAVDDIAEQIRAQDLFPAGSLAAIQKNSTVVPVEDMASLTLVQMIKHLHDDNHRVIMALYAAYNEAEKEKELGLANFLQDRIAYHDKLGWMLRANLK